MACTPTPTQTLFGVETTSAVSTSISDIVTTIPAEVSTFLSIVCRSSTVDANGTTSCLSTQSEEFFTTIRSAEVTTIESQFVVQIPITTSTPTATLFSTCPSPHSEKTTTTTTTTSDTPTSRASLISSGSIITTSSAISTLPDGSVIVSFMTTTVTQSHDPSLIPTNLGNSGDHTNPRKVGPIIGGVLGGLLGLLLICLLGWAMWRKRDALRAQQFRDQMWGSEQSSLYPRHRHRAKIDIDPSIIETEEPKPYQYGLVGRRELSPSRGSSPNPSPAPTRPESVAYAGQPQEPRSAGFLPPSPFSPGLNPGQGSIPYPYTPTFPYPHSQPPTPNAQQAYFSAAPATPASPPPLMQLSLPPMSMSMPMPMESPAPQQPPSQAVHRSSASVASVGTAISYPYQVPVPVVYRGSGLRDDEDEEDEEGGAEPGRERRPMRMSLTLANWNPDTDGELVPRVSEESGRRPGSGSGT